MNNTQRTNRGCRQCRDLIQTLTYQIKQLQSRQESLKKLNSTLIQNLMEQPIPNNQYLTDWKSKYQREVQRSCKLERQLMEIQIQSQIDKKSIEKKKDNVRKLNQMIMSAKLQGAENYGVQEFYTGRKMRLSVVDEKLKPNWGKKQLFVKIVR